ncbi:transposase [Amycolatopsis azurea]|uniref:transposase n=1 Tax=Amycolatopsis azurea TaxID=36819 RepID=UPI0037F40409
MPAPHPPEFRQRAVELASLVDKPVTALAKDLGISESCLRNWMAQADIDGPAHWPDCRPASRLGLPYVEHHPVDDTSDLAARTSYSYPSFMMPPHSAAVTASCANSVASRIRTVDASTAASDPRDRDAKVRAGREVDVAVQLAGLDRDSASPPRPMRRLVRPRSTTKPRPTPRVFTSRFSVTMARCYATSTAELRGRRGGRNLSRSREQ